MEDKNYEIVDRDLGTISEERPSRQIRTRRTSHDNILGVFTRARIALLNKKLNYQKSLAVSEKYSGIGGEKKAEKRASKIAQLEEKIMVLSREEVPENYVDDRAIKLKESMMENVRNNVGTLYITEMEAFVSDKGPNAFDARYGSAADVVEQIMTEASDEIGESAVDSETVDSEEIVSEVEGSETKEGDISIDPANADPKEIQELVEEGFDKAKETVATTDDAISAEDIKKVIDGEFVDVEDYVDSDDVRTAIDGAFDRLEQGDKTDGAVAIDDFVMPYDDTISTIFDETDPIMPYNDAISTVNGADVDLIPYDDSLSGVYDETRPGSRIEGEVQKAVKNYFNPPKGSNLLNHKDDNDLKDVIREEVRSALEHYDAELKKTVKDPRFSYKPMTDEEIAEAQKNLETPAVTSVFVPVGQVKNASSENVRVDGPALRDEIIVVPERKTGASTVTKKPVEEYQFSSVGDTTDVPEFVTKDIGSYDTKKLVELRARVARLKKARDAARNTAIAEERKLEEFDKKSRQVRSAADEKGASLERLYEEYAATLEESINTFDNHAKFARDAVEMEERYIQAQQGRNAELDDEISVVSGFRR